LSCPCRILFQFCWYLCIHVVSISVSVSYPYLYPYSPAHHTTFGERGIVETLTTLNIASVFLLHSTRSFKISLSLCLVLPRPRSAFILAILVVNLIISYILNALSLKHAAFFAMWFFVIFARLTFFLSVSSSLLVTFNSLCGFPTRLTKLYYNLEPHVPQFRTKL